jgi:chemotaxis protein CheX
MTGPETALTKEMHDAWLPILQLASQEVFELMLASKLEVAASGLQDSGLDLTAMVGLSGQICGVLTIRCSSKSAEVMACRMLGVDPEAAKEAMCDAAGEVCNMVAGNFKNKISGLGDGCMLSVPTVITGGDYSVHPQASDPALRALMTFESAPVVLSLEIHS